MVVLIFQLGLAKCSRKIPFEVISFQANYFCKIHAVQIIIIEHFTFIELLSKPEEIIHIYSRISAGNDVATEGKKVACP